MTAALHDHDAAQLARRIGSAGPGSVLFWSGAGVSMPAPSGLPSAAEMIDRVFARCYEADALSVIVGYHARSGWLTSRLCDRGSPRSVRLPRLETAIGVAVRMLGDTAHRVLDTIEGAPWNANHLFFAAHLWAGGNHVTGNFDTCIEEAHKSQYGSMPPAGRIEHFHGFLDASTSAAGLGATLEAVQGGFPAEYGDRLVDLVAGAAVTVVVGYSGSDFFDVDVAFVGLANDRLAGCQVFWIGHSDCRWHEVTPPTEPALARLMRQAGATVSYACGASSQLLVALAAQWRLSMASPAMTRSVGSPARDRLAISERDRRRATLDLYRELGLPAEIERLLSEADLGWADQAQLLRARSELLWEQGRWNDLRRFWGRVSLPDAVSAATRAERIGACLWAQGRLMPAYLWLGMQRLRLSRRASPGDLWALRETQARVIEHMSRTPGLVVLGRALAPGAARRLGAADQAAGVQRFRRHHDLSTSLTAISTKVGRDAATASESQLWFAEAGSVIGAVAYGHRRLRDAYTPTRPRADVVRDYRAHQRWALAIGSRAAAWRMLLLPDAHRVFSWSEVLAGVLILQYGPWHRIRILVRHLVKRMTERR